MTWLLFLRVITSAVETRRSARLLMLVSSDSFRGATPTYCWNPPSACLKAARDFRGFESDRSTRFTESSEFWR